MAIDRFRLPAPWGSEDIPPGPRPKDRKELLTMGQQNKLMQLAQAGGSPYDEMAYMSSPSDFIGRGNMAYSVRARPMGYGESPVNTFLNDRLYDRYMGTGASERGAGEYTDAELEMIYGPPDQVVYGNNGNGAPLRLDDPAHPRNQRPQFGAPPTEYGYPQRRR